MTRVSVRMGGLTVALLGASMARAAEGGKPVVVVTTYITETQKERKDTRFTLTEWLRIKERMKEMDLWLALMSDPSKSVFQPELDLAYGQTRGTMTVVPDSSDQGGYATGPLTGKYWTGQIWLTNLVSSKFGIRTLNIDMGGEGGVRKSDAFVPVDAPRASVGTRDWERQHWAVDFRVFGRNIQDSSLVFKVGRYGNRNRVARDDVYAATDVDHDGMLAGAQMHLYLSSWLGVEGSYTKFGAKSSLESDVEATGTSWDGMAYIEISLLRFMIGRYGEVWNWPARADGSTETSMSTLKEYGYMAGVKLML